jgi:hypothetical protein
MKFTKAQLEEQIVTLKAKLGEATSTIELLREQLKDHAALRSDMVRMVTHTPKPTQRSIVPVYEWNPAVPGDFQRALGLAKENHGRCVRMRQGSPS